MPRDDLPLEAAKLCMHPLDYAQLRHCAREAGCDVDGADICHPNGYGMGLLIIAESTLLPEGQVAVFDRNNELLGIIQLGH